MKVSSRIYKGIEYIQLNDLPEDQQEIIREALENSFIKILIDKNIISNCIQYKDYESWFDATYQPQGNLIKIERHAEAGPLKLILGKA